MFFALADAAFGDDIADRLQKRFVFGVVVRLVPVSAVPVVNLRLQVVAHRLVFDRFGEDLADPWAVSFDAFGHILCLASDDATQLIGKRQCEGKPIGIPTY